MLTYLIYHDCGKPLCMEIDGDGKRHFNDHAAISKKAWIDAGGDDTIAHLIGMDMDLHLMKSGQEEEFSQRREACSLIIAAFCEIHSNAEMFGGLESTSFKIKHKHLLKFGKRIFDKICESK